MRSIWALFLLLVTAGGLAAEVRVWEDSSGKTSVRAELLGSDGTTVTLLKEDGQEVEVPIEKLSPADRLYLAELEASQTEEEFMLSDEAAGKMGAAMMIYIGVLLLLGLIVWIWWLVAAFSESGGWGIAMILFFPLPALIMLFTHWERAKGPFFGLILYFVVGAGGGFLLLMTMKDKVDEDRTRQAEQLQDAN